MVNIQRFLNENPTKEEQKKINYLSFDAAGLSFRSEREVNQISQLQFQSTNLKSSQLAQLEARVEN